MSRGLLIGSSPTLTTTVQWKSTQAEVQVRKKMSPCSVVPPEVIPISHFFSDLFSAYRLKGFITHMGSNIDSGHYVAHILVDGKWVFYNDGKVTDSKEPPRELAYMYLYERTD